MSWRYRDPWLDAAAGVALAAFAAGLTPVMRVPQSHARPRDAVGIVLLVVAGGTAALLRRRPLIGYVVAIAAPPATWRPGPGAGRYT